MRRTGKMLRLCGFHLIFCQVYLTLANGIVQPGDVRTATVGDNVTLTCLCSIEEFSTVLWYKVGVGSGSRLVAHTNSYLTEIKVEKEYKEAGRFHLHGDKGIFNLTISHAQTLDTAAYFCGIVFSYGFQFGAGTFLIVTGGSSLSVRVTQQPAASVPAQPGDSVTLQCTVDSGSCAGEHSVYWFTLASGESQPGVIYSHGGRSAECEKSPEAGSVPQSCVYSLPVNHADTYYCAVAACGHMVLGNGTTVGDGGGCDPSIWIILSLVLALSVVANIALLIINMKKRSTGGITVSPQRVTEVDSHQQDRHSEDLLHYAALNLKKPKPQRKKREPKEDTVYSDLR